MSQVSYRVREYLWVTAPIELEIFCNQLGNDLQLPAFRFDCENVYEWGLTKIEHGYLEINISRKHNKGTPLFNEPICVLFLVENIAPISYDKAWVMRNFIQVYGQAIANLVKQTVYYGTVEYLGNEDFSYQPSQTFKPQE